MDFTCEKHELEIRILTANLELAELQLKQVKELDI